MALPIWKKSNSYSKNVFWKMQMKKDKSLKSRTSGGFVTTPMSVSQHPSYSTYSGEPEMVPSDSMGGLGGLAGKGDFDRRKKKKYAPIPIVTIDTECKIVFADPIRRARDLRRESGNADCCAVQGSCVRVCALAH